MLRHVLLFLLASMPLLHAESFEQITILGNSGNLQLEKLSIKVNRFDKETITAMSQDTTLRICESIDNSKLVIIGQYLPANAIKAVFDQGPVVNSLKSLFKRGGCLFWGPPSWDIVNAFPISLKTFFKDVNASLITVNQYCDPGAKQKKEIILKGTANEDYPGDLLRKPNFNLTVQTVRHFGDISQTKFKVLFKSQPDNLPLMVIEENILGKGSIIFTYTFSIFKATGNPFMTNLVFALYGERKIASSKSILREKLNTTAPTTVEDKELKVLELTQRPKVEFYNYRNQKALIKTTTAQISINDKDLIVDFHCQEPDAGKLKSVVTRRDANLWEDDCVELVIADSDKQDANVYQFIVNSKGVCYDSKNGSTGWNPEYQVTAAVKDGYWEAQLTIPLAVLGFTGDHLKGFKINLCRTNTENKEITSWNPFFHQFADTNAMGYATILLRAEFLKNRQVASKAAGTGQVTLWQVPTFTKVYNDTFPTSTVDLKDVKVLVARNEKECVSILISNTTDENIYFRLEPQRELTGTTVGYRRLFTIKEAMPWRDPQGKVFNEALVNLNQGNIIVLPSLETRELWIDVKTEIAAGDYRWSFTLVPINYAMPSKKLDFEVKVLPWRFPDQLPVFVYTFGPYFYSWAKSEELRAPYWKACLEYHINTIQTVDGPYRAIQKDGTISGHKEDYINQEKLLQESGCNWVYGYGVYVRFKSELKSRHIDGTITNPKMQELFRQWISNWVKYLKEEQVDLNKFLIPLCDEPAKPIIDELLIASRIIHEIEPRLKITCTIPTWSTLEDVKKLSPAIDVWIPWEPRITTRSEAAAELEYYKFTQKPFFAYNCSTSGNSSPYLDYFRFRGIRGFLAGTDGIALWAANSWRGNDWNSTENAKDYSAFLFHHGDDGPIPTIRLEAFREAVEDLYMILEAAKSQDPELQKLIDAAYLKKLMDADSPLAVQAWRNQLLIRLSAIKK